MITKSTIIKITTFILLLISLPLCSQAQTITTFAGTGKWGNTGDGGPASAAQLNQPVSVTVDRSGDIFIADQGNHNLRRVAVDGTITTMANTPGKTAIDSFSVAIDSLGNTYIADTKHNVVRKITGAGVTIFAGTGEAGYSGDGGPAAKAMLDAPRGVAADRWGNVYIADSRNDAVRRVDEHGVITTFAGNGIRQYHGDEDMIGSVAYTRDRGSFKEGAAATAAQLFWPMDVAVDNDGNVYIADDANHVVERVTAPPHMREPPAKTEIAKTEIRKRQRMATANSQAEIFARPLPEMVIGPEAEPQPIGPVSVPEPVQPQPTAAFAVSADPDAQELTISIVAGTYTSFTITDAAGKILIQRTITSTETKVDISALQPALYYINMKKEDRVKTAMFVKEK